MRPKASQALCTAASRTEPPAATSSSTATARGPWAAASEALISSQSERSRSARRAAATTRQPARARSRQKSRPMPEEAPVTSTTCPSILLHGGGDSPADGIAGAGRGFQSHLLATVVASEYHVSSPLFVIKHVTNSITFQNRMYCRTKLLGEN